MLNSFKAYIAALIGRLSSVKVKEYLVSLLKKEAVKLALKKLVIAGGFKAWLITFVVEHLVELGDEKVIEPAFRKVGFVGDVLEGQIIYKKVQNAQDRDDWRDVIRDA